MIEYEEKSMSIWYERKTPPLDDGFMDYPKRDEDVSAGMSFEETTAITGPLPVLEKKPAVSKRRFGRSRADRRSASARPGAFVPTMPPRIRREAWSNELSGVILTSTLLASILFNVIAFKDVYFNFGQYAPDVKALSAVVVNAFRR